MKDFNELLQGFRLRRLADNDFMSANTPDLGVPQLDDLAAIEEELKDGPAAQAYQEHLRTPPDPSTMGVGPVKGILAALAGGLAGFGQNSAVAGATLGRSVIDAPYNHAIRNYTAKAKALGEMAEIESEKRKEKRLWTESMFNRRARQLDQEENRKTREALAANRPARSYKPDVEYDDKGFATGRVFDPDEMVMKEVPGLKGFRRSGESPTITKNKLTAREQLNKGNEALRLFNKLNEKQLPVIGNPHVGPGQGWLSRLGTDVGLIDDADVRDFHQLTQELANEKLYTLSGAQINNKEYERLRKTMADTNRSESAYKADIERMLKFQRAAAEGWLSENDPNHENWIPENDPRLSGGGSTGTSTGAAPGAPRRFNGRRLN